MNPKDNSLVVCAGTVTCHKVGNMGSGFLLFKKIFNNHGSCNKYIGGWEAELQTALDAYHKSGQTMPPYIRVASQDTFIGGVATVPTRSGSNALTPKLPADKDEREKTLKTQYKSAVYQAILDAKELKRPLFLQPLGIGVYGWEPKEAAILFAEAILEADPENEVNITIPIFNTKAGTADQIFSQTLIEEMTKKGRHYSGRKIQTIFVKN